MNFKLIFTLVIASSLALDATSQQQALPAEWKTLEISGHSIAYPEMWEPDTSGNMGSVFFLHAPLTNEEDTFMENINLILQNLADEKMKSKAYISRTIEQITTYLKDYKIIQNAKTKKNNKECYVLEYSGSMNNFELHFLQYIWVQKGKAYILTFTATSESFELYRPTAIQMLESMKLKF